MGLQEHSIALISVIVGLGLTELLGNFNRLMSVRRDVRWDALSLAWAFLAALLVTNYWWGMYQGYVSATSASSAATFLVGLSMPVLLYLICAAALPNARTLAGREMRASYLAESGYFFALVLLYIVATLVQSVVINRAFSVSVAMMERLAIIAVLAPLLWRRRIGYHWFAALVILAVLMLRLFEQALH
jgi:hypothetical protein